MENDGDRPDNLRSHSPALQRLQRDATALFRRVVKERVPLSEISIEVDGWRLGFLMREVRRQMLVVLGKMEDQCHKGGNLAQIPVIRSRFSELFGINERYLPGRIRTPDLMEKDLLKFGNVYVETNSRDVLAEAKLQIETAFIAQCKNVEQQKKIIEIVDGITEADLIFVEVVEGLLWNNLKKAIFQQLKFPSMLIEEDIQSSRSGQIRAINAPSGTVPITRVKLDTPSSDSRSFETSNEQPVRPKKSLSQQEIQAWKLEWGDIDWKAED